MIKQTSIVNGWPDALRCGMGSVPGQVFILHGVSPRRDATLGAIYIQVFPPGDRAVSFLPDGIYASRSGHDESSKGCEGKSIQQLYEEERAFNFVTSKEQDFSGQTSMVAGWPDAIACGVRVATGGMFFAHNVGPAGFLSLYEQMVGGENRAVYFTDKRMYDHRAGNDGSSKGCEGKSIVQLYNEGRAFNFVTSKEQDFSGQTSMVAGWPDAIRCGSDATYASGCILMLHGGVNGTSALYSHVSIEQRDVLFGAEGGYLSRVGLDDVTKGCKGKSILQLYNEGRAFNFVTSKWPSAHEMSNGFSIGMLLNTDIVLVAWSPGQNIEESMGKGIVVSIYDYNAKNKKIIEAVEIDKSDPGYAVYSTSYYM